MATSQQPKDQYTGADKRAKHMNLERLTVLLLLATFLCGYASAGVLNFSTAKISAGENQGSLTVQVIRSGALSQAASVTVVSQSGTAKSPADFSTVSETLEWAAGDSEAKEFTVTLNDDRLRENSETFVLKLLSPVGDILGVNAQKTVTITDYEEGSVTFSSVTYDATEESGSVAITINRTGGSDGNVSVKLDSSDGTAKNGSDYTTASLELNFLDGQKSTEVNLSLIDDLFTENKEQFNLTLSSPTSGAVLGEQSSATVIISDLDANFDAITNFIASNENPNIQGNLIDLANSKFPDSESYMDMIKDMQIFKDGGARLNQFSNGVLEIIIGQTDYYFLPQSVSRTIVPTDAAKVTIDNDGNPVLLTSDNILFGLKSTLAPAALNLFEGALGALSIPEYEISESGNITIQANQGPPTLETLSNGEIRISASYYTRWNFLPSPDTKPSPETNENLFSNEHPIYPAELFLSVIYFDGSSFRRQDLYSAPLSGIELAKFVEGRVGFTGYKNLGQGRIQFTTLPGINLSGFEGKRSFEIFSDYQIRKVLNFKESMSGFFLASDVNGDGVNDFKAIYNSGFEQYFITKSSQ